MPTHSASNDQIKQLYVDGHFCNAYKIGIVTNGLGIVRHLDFYNKDFLESHPELIPNKKSDSPDEDKSIHDARLLIPTLPMKYECISKLRSGVPRYKFVCPKMIWDYNPKTKRAHRKCICDNPCTDSKCGRMIYIDPEKNLRAYQDTLRGTPEWDLTYKIRTTVERSINHFKDCFGLAGRKTQNEKTLHADLVLSGKTQLISVILADKIHQHQLIRSIKPLIA